MIISLPLAGTPTEALCGHQQQQENEITANEPQSPFYPQSYARRLCGEGKEIMVTEPQCPISCAQSLHGDIAEKEKMDTILLPATPFTERFLSLVTGFPRKTPNNGDLNQ